MARGGVTVSDGTWCSCSPPAAQYLGHPAQQPAAAVLQCCSWGLQRTDHREAAEPHTTHQVLPSIAVQKLFFFTTFNILFSSIYGTNLQARALFGTFLYFIIHD